MKQYTKTFEVRWSEIDLNRHLRHSVYLDYASHTRISLFNEHGMSINRMEKLGLGPIIFREEIKYLQEVRKIQEIVVDCKIDWMYEDGSRWSFFHRLFKESDTPVAEIVVDGAWLDLGKRKLGIPTDELMNIMKNYPRSADFEWKKS